jgi:hypothetical protein
VEISVGRYDGVKLGDVFTVYRGRQQLGKLKITRVDKDLSTAKITDVKDTMKLQRGDLAIRNRRRR